MDERDLQQFQDYVREFERTVGDKRTSQGLANLVMIQKSLGDRALSPVKLEDDAVYTSGRNGGISRVSHMKVELDGASEDTFRPLIEGLRRSTLTVRLKNSFYDIIEPLASELMVQQLNKMSHENELHREDVIYYRHIVNAIDNLGKSNRNSFLESVLLGYRRFARNPIWTSLNWALSALQTVVFRPLMGILTGFKKKSDTQKIIDAIHQQTEFMRTGEIQQQGYLDRFMEKGLAGVMSKSVSDSFKYLAGTGGPATATANSPQQLVVRNSEIANMHLDKMRLYQKMQLKLTEMMYNRIGEIKTSAMVIADGIIDLLSEYNRSSNLSTVLQKAQISISQAIDQHSIQLQKNANFINEEILINGQETNNHLKSIFEGQQVLLGDNRLMEQQFIPFRMTTRNGIETIDAAQILSEVAQNHFQDSKIDQGGFFEKQQSRVSRLRGAESSTFFGGTEAEAKFYRETTDTLSIMRQIQQEHHEEVATEQLEQQKKTRKELEEHNRREKRRTFFGFFTRLLPALAGLAAIGAAWFMLPDRFREVVTDSVGSAVSFGFEKAVDAFGLKNTLTGLSAGAIGLAVATGFLKLGLATKAGLVVASVWGIATLTGKLAEWVRGKQDERSPAELMREAKEEFERGGPLGSSITGWDSRFALTHENQRPILESRQRELEARIQELRDERRRTGEYGRNQELIDLTKELQNLRGSIDSLEGSNLMEGMISPVALHSALQVSGGSSSTGMSGISSGMDFVRRHEGLRTEAYLDQAGIPTIGYGNTMINGRPVRMGDKITEEQAERMFQEDFMNRRSAVSNMVSVPLEPHQLDALTSLSYNIGLGAFRSSTLLRNLNSGDFAGAQEQFGEWNKITDPETGQKVVSRGLTRRREEEAAMFGGAGVAQQATTPVSPIPSNDTPTISREAISSAGQVTAGAGGDTREEEVGLLSSIASGMRRLIQIMQERGDSGGINLSDTGTSHAAYGD